MAQAEKKNLRAIQEIQVRPLGHEEPLNYEMATHLSILAWERPWTEKSGGLRSMGSIKLLCSRGCNRIRSD